MRPSRVVRLAAIAFVVHVAHLACAHPLAAQAASDSLPDPVTVFLRDFNAQAAPMIDAGNYLGVVRLLETLRDKTGTPTEARATAAHLMGTYTPFVGQLQEALDALAATKPVAVTFNADALLKLKPEDGVDAVARLATSHQIVLIGEERYMPRHRAFTATLLPKLYASGFRYLAVETLAEGDTGLAARKYPVHSSGFYSNEPIAGELLRTALALGFTVVPFDVPDSAGDARERGLAQRLVDRILKADPKAKIVVHAGSEHVAKVATGSVKPMAMHLRELTGIDPLTVDQSTLTERADTTYEDDRYILLMKHVRSRTPYVLRDSVSGAVYSARPGVHDVTIIHPRAVYRAGRPNWLWTLGGRHAYIASDEACPRSLDCVMTARKVGESNDAVPIDILRVQFSAPGSKTFALPPGQYVIEARDVDGTPLSRQTITVR